MTATDEARRIAAEYVLGTLDARERENLRARIAGDPGFATLVHMWESRFAPLHELSASAAPPAALWDEILAGLPPEAVPDEAPELMPDEGPAVDEVVITAPLEADALYFLEMAPLVEPSPVEPPPEAAADDIALVTTDAGEAACDPPPKIAAEAASSEFAPTGIKPVEDAPIEDAAIESVTIEVVPIESGISATDGPDGSDRDVSTSDIRLSDTHLLETAAARAVPPPVPHEDAAPVIEDSIDAHAGADPATSPEIAAPETSVPEVVGSETAPIRPASDELPVGDSDIPEPNVPPTEPAESLPVLGPEQNLIPSEHVPSEFAVADLAPSDLAPSDPVPAEPVAESFPVAAVRVAPPPHVEATPQRNPWRVASGLLMLGLLLLAAGIAYRETRRPTSADFFAVLHPQPMAGVALILEPGNGTVSVVRVPEAAPEGMRYNLWVSSPGLGTRRICVFQSAGVVQSRELASLGRAALNDAQLLLTLEPEGADPSSPSGETVYSGRTVPR